MGMGEACGTIGCGRLGGHPGDCVFPTKDEAIAAAFASSEEGEEVAIHESRCATAVGEACTCTPTVHVVRKGLA